MRIVTTDNLETAAAYRKAWDGLAGACTFRCWDWVSAWWNHYLQNAPDRTALIVLAVEDHATEHELAAVLPAYIHHTPARGNVLRLMGDGEVCSDHLGLLCSSKQRQDVVQAVAEALFAQHSEWDVADLQAVSSEDEATHALSAALAEMGCRVDANKGLNTWAIDLPETWDAFLAMQSKSHRKQLRRSERRFEQTQDSSWTLLETDSDYARSWLRFVDLHQKRRQSLGEPGCFSSEQYAAFHEELSERLLRAGKLRLSTTTFQGRPVAAEYHFVGGHTTYAYQGGLEPEAEAQGPGGLSLMGSIKQAISEGHRTFDFLRGDEPYKAHWRATPRATHNIAIVPPRSKALLRYRAWSSLRSTKRWLTGNPLAAPVDVPAHGATST